MPDADAVANAVRSHYAAAAKSASARNSPAGRPDRAGPGVFGAARYDVADLADLPPEAVAASIGCANPVAVADLRTGETVLDLGSGGGIDVLLSARRVGPRGRAYGIDMTEESSSSLAPTRRVRAS